MSEGTYEYECMRAELLGIEKPDYDDFMKRKLEEEAKQTEEEQANVEILKVALKTKQMRLFFAFFSFQEADVQGEQLKNVSGGLEELNSILSMTQKKIDRFKVSGVSRLFRECFYDFVLGPLQLHHESVED